MPNRRAAIAAGDTGTTGSTTYFGSFNCDPATIQPNGAGNIYYSAQSTMNVANTTPNAQALGCNASWKAGDEVPAETRSNGMISINEKLER